MRGWRTVAGSSLSSSLLGTERRPPKKAAATQAAPTGAKGRDRGVVGCGTPGKSKPKTHVHRRRRGSLAPGANPRPTLANGRPPDSAPRVSSY